MAKKTSHEERDLFQQAMKGVRPLKKESRDEKIISPSRHIPFKRKSSPSKTAPPPLVKQTTLSDFVEQEVQPETHLSFIRPGVQPRYFKHLKNGRFSIEAELDLHRLTTDDAREQLGIFIKQSMRNQLRVVRIIHGKGTHSGSQPPLLKNLVNTWLPQFHEVLAFCSTQPRDGGTGAVYVLLRKI